MVFALRGGEGVVAAREPVVLEESDVFELADFAEGDERHGECLTWETVFGLRIVVFGLDGGVVWLMVLFSAWSICVLLIVVNTQFCHGVAMFWEGATKATMQRYSVE